MNKSTDSRAQVNGRLQQNHRVTSLDLHSLARALGGKVSNGQVLAPGPGHSADDQSLSVKIDPAAPDGFVVHSFAGEDAIALKDYVRSKAGLPAFKPNGSRHRHASANNIAVSAVESEPTKDRILEELLVHGRLRHAALRSLAVRAKDFSSASARWQGRPRMEAGRAPRALPLARTTEISRRHRVRV
jgi:hypothetical protein